MIMMVDQMAWLILWGSVVMSLVLDQTTNGAGQQVLTGHWYLRFWPACGRYITDPPVPHLGTKLQIDIVILGVSLYID